MSDGAPLTDKRYWQATFGRQKPTKFGKPVYARYYSKFLEPSTAKNCVDVGAFPGANLGYLASTCGYRPTAVDFVDNASLILENMRFNGIDNCTLVNQDFLTWSPEETFDVVCSHGFIEHFTDYESILDRHVALLSSSGTLFLTVPYLGGFQGWVRRRLYSDDRWRQVLATHNREAMNVSRLSEILFRKHRLIRLFRGYIRFMTIWISPTTPPVREDRMAEYHLYQKVARIARRLHISNALISPEILIVARKPDHPTSTAGAHR